MIFIFGVFLCLQRTTSNKKKKKKTKMFARSARLEDLEALLRLEERCWEEPLRASREVIIWRLSQRPDSQFVLEDHRHQVCGVLYTQRIKNKDFLSNGSFQQQERLHSDEGSLLHLLAISVKSSEGNGAALLRNHALDMARRDPQLTGVVAMTRCSAFPNFKSLDVASVEEYEKYVMSGRDPTIFFHVSGGAKIVEIVQSYRPEDIKNNGCAVLIEYSLKLDGRDFTENNNVDNFATSVVDHSTIIQDICLKLAQINPLCSGVKELSSTPFMTVLDSLQMLSMHEWLEKLLKQNLTPSFLFKYTTANSVIQWLTGKCTISEVSQVAPSTEPIAIVGVACRFPGKINSLSELWETMLNKSCTSTAVPFDRWDLDQIINKVDLAERKSMEWGCFITNEDYFDPSCFGMSVSEAENMDPNQRILLENVLKALYDAGFRKDDLADQPVGVFIGMSGSDYLSIPGCAIGDRQNAFSATGSAVSMAAGRISYYLGTHGPAMVVDTACSSSLVALQQAINSLKTGASKAAIVAGINLMLTPWTSLAYSIAGMTSPDGKCHTFDESANGYCRGEGCGALVLKRLDDAMRDGDGIYAVVRGSAVMHDGKSASLTAPNGLAQEQLLRAALADAGVSASEVCHVESHGTGTKLGDPIETEALGRVYGAGREEDNPLSVSGVKGNIGHLEAAAGVGGVLSAVLALQHQQAPPNAQLRELNSKVAASVSGCPIVFPREASALRRRGDRRLLAGVSSFGYSGTIAHVVLEEAPEGHGRTLGDERGRIGGGEQRAGDVKGVVWQFAGQGTLKSGVLRGMFEQEAAYRSALQECDKILRECLGVGATELLYPDSSTGAVDVEVSRSRAEELLSMTEYSQPILVSLEYSLCQVWLSKGVRPSAVLGHSLGEYAACVVAGVFSLQDCLRLACERGRLMQRRGWLRRENGGGSSDCE